MPGSTTYFTQAQHSQETREKCAINIDVTSLQLPVDAKTISAGLGASQCQCVPPTQTTYLKLLQPGPNQGVPNGVQGLWGVTKKAAQLPAHSSEFIQCLCLTCWAQACAPHEMDQQPVSAQAQKQDTMRCLRDLC